MIIVSFSFFKTSYNPLCIDWKELCLNAIMVSFSIFKTSYNPPCIEWKELCIGTEVTFFQGTNLSMTHILHAVAIEYISITREFQTGDGRQ